MSERKWADAPPSVTYIPRDSTIIPAALVEEMMVRKGKWVLIRTYKAKGVAHATQQRLQKKFPQLKVISRAISAERYELWTTYIGEEDTGDAPGEDLARFMEGE